MKKLIHLHVAMTKAAPRVSSFSFKDASLYQSPGSKCKPCPVVHPIPVCGSDGHTYSSQVPLPSPSYPHLYPQLCTNQFRFVSLSVQCKLEYQSCITGKKIVLKCPGMCPCPAQAEPSSAEKKGTRLPHAARFALSPNRVETAPNWCRMKFHFRTSAAYCCQGAGYIF